MFVSVFCGGGGPGVRGAVREMTSLEDKLCLSPPALPPPPPEEEEEDRRRPRAIWSATFLGMRV